MSETHLAPDKSSDGSALLIIDMISSWEAPDMKPLMRAAKQMAPCLARVKARCREANVPVIYVNDNLGRWRSDFKSIVQAAEAQGGDAADIALLLAPDHHDYFVLKPKHSAFFATPLHQLLAHLEAHRLILCGVSADQCVLATAIDALMHDFQVVVLRDGIAAPSPHRTQRALQHLEEATTATLLRSVDVVVPVSSAS